MLLNTEDPNYIRGNCDSVIKGKNNIILQKKPTSITENTLLITQQCGQAKYLANVEEYELLNTIVQQRCRSCKENRDRNKTIAIYKKTKQTSRDFEPRTGEIKKGNDSIL